jgi:MYXO-CTERM domain-containing protein
MRYGVQTLWPSTIGLTVLLAAAVSQAQVCPPPPPDLYPADGAPAVPLNGVVRVVFHEPYEAELPNVQLLRLFEEGSGRQIFGEVTLQVQGSDTRLELVTDELLSAEQDYQAIVVLPAFAGDLEFFFRTSSVIDTSAPEFAGARSIRVVPANDVTCAESTGPVPPQEADLEPNGRGFRVTVSFPQAIDEAGAANIDYLLVQTSGPTLDEPWLRKSVRTSGSDSLFGAVFLPRAAVARDEICFEVHAVDMFGNVVNPGREACGDPIGPGYFESICSVGAAGAPASPPAGFLLALAAVSLGRRRSPRRAVRRPPP